ncbi:MAG: hypothetical protein PHD03_04120 [Bacilli bacterium]|nr:hypothetical protein [Bacilli bacterium]MDD4407066.1 hypothetical protein [Bacilli bacterium]
MKNLFKIHPITYVILLSVLLTGYFNYFLIISIILIIHDLGHIIMFKILNYKIKEIIILPFGSIIKSNINLSNKTLEIFLISIAGILFQILLYPIMDILNNLFVNDISYKIFLNYNKIIILFNLLPIIPLDGSKIMLCFLENILSYKKALKIINIISVILIILLILYITYYGINSIIIISFLVYKTIDEIINHKYIFNKFLLERTLIKNNNKGIKYIKHIKNIFKNKYNFINNKSEDKVLKSLFMP